MKYNNYLPILFLALIIAGCNSMDYKKTKSGLLYKIISSGRSKDSVAKENDFLKFHYTTKLNDSVLQTTYGKMPAYYGVPPAGQSDYNPVEIFSMLRKGDSAVVVMLVDSLIKKGLANQLPPGAKKGDRIITTFKILNIFKTRELVQADYEAEQKKDMPRQQKEMQEQMQKQQKETEVQKVKGAQEVEAYLTKNKINTQKTPKGAYVEILNPGQGPQADSSTFVSLKYKGKTFEGRVFDTNMDSSFHHMEPLQFTVGSGQMWAGFDDGIRFLKKGGKANIYIPGALASGPNPIGQGGKPYENVIFEIELLDVKANTGNH